MADLFEEDAEFAAAVEATFHEIEAEPHGDGTGRVTFSAFMSWWSLKELEVGGEEPSDAALNMAQPIFDEYGVDDDDGLGIEALGALAEVVVGLELEGFLAEPPPDGVAADDDDDDVDTEAGLGEATGESLLDGLDDLEMGSSSGEEEEQEEQEQEEQEEQEEGEPPEVEPVDESEPPEAVTAAAAAAEDGAEEAQGAAAAVQAGEAAGDGGDGGGDDDFDEERAEYEAMSMEELQMMAADLGADPSQVAAAGDDKSELVTVLLGMDSEGPPEQLDDDATALLDGLDDLDLSTSEEEEEEGGVAGGLGAGGDPVFESSVDPAADAALRDAFRSIDAEGRGEIDPEEFADLCNQLDPLMSEDGKSEFERASAHSKRARERERERERERWGRR
jgi:hypothetical protein